MRIQNGSEIIGKKYLPAKSYTDSRYTPTLPTSENREV
jgi:hypothetical protein